MRVNAAERTIENLQKESRASGLKGLEDRMAKLEAVVKAMAEAKAGDKDKVVAMDKTVKALESAKLVDKPTLDKLMSEAGRKQVEEITKGVKATTDKLIADAMKAAEVAKMESRLIVLEAKVASLGR